MRVGILGHVGRFATSEPTVFRRGCRVLCRTVRGLEVGEVLSLAERNAVPPAESSAEDGLLVRAITVEDDLVLARLERNKEEAYQACIELLREQAISAVLMDVEQLFDGSGIYFYFMGEVTDQIERVTQELADAYETKIQFREFADAVERGCGPDCGTESASGCGSTGGCSSCSIAAACSKSN